MVFGAIAGALASGAAQAAVGYGLSKLAGGKSGSKSLAKAQPLGFDGGGLHGRVDGGKFVVGSTTARQNVVGSLAATFPEQAANIAALRSQVTPGVSALRQSRLDTLGNSRRRSIGDLRENLQRRRVLGSSFAEDAITRREAEFAQEEDRIVAESFLQELDLTHQLINEEFEIGRGEFQTRLDEMNLKAELAANLSGKASSQLNEIAQLKAKLAASEAAGTGKFLGQAFQPSVDAIGSGVTNYFTPKAA